MFKKSNNKEGFSLVELIVVIAIIGILVMLGSGKLMDRTKGATKAKHLSNIKTLEASMDRFFLDHDRFPRLSEEPYTDEEVLTYSERIFDITGEKVTLNPDGKYYDIDYIALQGYVNVPENNDKPNYILQNPAGKVYFMEGLTDDARTRANFTTSNPIIKDDKVVESHGMTEKEIDLFFEANKDYIPIATSNDLNAIKSNASHIFAKGTKWQREASGGLNRKYVQVNDIDLSSIKNFTPIGDSDVTNAFQGTYSGGNFKIINLKIDRGNIDYAGLFGYTFGATIENVGLIDVDVKGRHHVGGLVGRNYFSSTIENSYATGSINGNNYVGGLIGQNYNSSTIKDSYATGNVNGSGSYAGGLVGFNHSSRIGNSYATGSINGNNYVGGLIGQNRNSSTTSSSYATGNVNGSGSYVGGLVGLNQTSSTIENSYATGNVTGSSSTGGLVGDNNSTVKNSYYDKEATNQSDTGKGEGLTTIEMQKQSSYINWDFGTTWQISSNEYPVLKWQSK